MESASSVEEHNAVAAPVGRHRTSFRTSPPQIFFHRAPAAENASDTELELLGLPKSLRCGQPPRKCVAASLWAAADVVGLTLHMVGHHWTYKQAQVKQTLGTVMDDRLLRKLCCVLKLVSGQVQDACWQGEEVVRRAPYDEIGDAESCGGSFAKRWSGAIEAHLSIRHSGFWRYAAQCEPRVEPPKA